MRPTGLRSFALAMLFVAGVAPLAAQNASSSIIQRVLLKVNGEFFTQKELEEKQIDRLQETGKGTLQGDALAQAVTEIMPDLLVNAVDEILLLQRGRELAFHMSDDQFKDMVDSIKKDNNLN